MVMWQTARSTNEAQNSAIFLHTRETGHSFDNKDFQILDKEKQWHRRGIKEAIWERIEQPSLNKKGGLRNKQSISRLGQRPQTDAT